MCEPRRRTAPTVPGMDRDHTLDGHATAPPGMHGLRDEPWMPAGPAGLAGWSLSLREPPAPGVPFDPSIPHPARVYDYWLGGYFL